MRNPVPGDVFVRLEYLDEETSPGFATALLSAMRLKSSPPSVLQLDYRLVLDTSPHTVFWRAPKDEPDQTRANWLAEWLDWQVEAHQVASAGVPVSENELYSITGLRELPFDLPTKE